MKKRKIILLMILVLTYNLGAYDLITYKVIEPTISYYYDNGLKIGSVKRNYTYGVSTDNNSIYGEWFENKHIYTVMDKNNNYHQRIPVYSLELANSKYRIPETLISYTRNGFAKKVIPSYFLDILKSKNKEHIYEYNTIVPSSFCQINNPSEKFSEDQNFFAVVTNVGICMYNNDEIDFVDIKKISSYIVEIESFLHSGCENEDYDYECFNWRVNIKTSTPKGQTERIQLKIDGDYLEINNLNRNEHIDTLVYVDDNIIEELTSLFSTNTCNLSKVTWPHHADGTCDYDNSSTTENLKLRSGEATTTSVLTVMQAGTKVKILELGKAETIDGINSNWGKVEIISGKDWDGNIIKAGTTGWCYGGYLQ